MSDRITDAQEILSAYDSSDIVVDNSELADALQALVLYTESLEAGLRGMLSGKPPTPETLHAWITDLVAVIQRLLEDTVTVEEDEDIVGGGYVSEEHQKLRAEREQRDAAEIATARAEGRFNEPT